MLLVAGTSTCQFYRGILHLSPMHILPVIRVKKYGKISFRQGSNELDRSCSRARSSPVMLSAAKHLAADRDGPFASLRVTLCDSSHCQGLSFTIEPCLNKTNFIIMRIYFRISAKGHRY